MTARRNTKPAEDVDLLAGMEDAEPAEEDEGELDLLEGISEDNGVAWKPADDDDLPKGIQGRVTYVGSVENDYGDDPIPLIEIRSADGTEWSVRGYHTALRSQIEKIDPEVGDLVAFKYLGMKPGKRIDKKTKEPIEYYNYKARKA